MTIYRGVGGVNREIKQQFRGVSSVNREIKEQYRGVDGVNRKVFSNATYILKDGVYTTSNTFEKISNYQTETFTTGSGYIESYMAQTVYHNGFGCVNTIDLSPYSKIKAKVLSASHSRIGYGSSLHLLVYKKYYTDVDGPTAQVNIMDDTVYSIGEKTVELDVSSLNDTLVVVVGFNYSGYSRVCDVKLADLALIK